MASIAIFLVSLGLIGPFWFANPGKFVLETDAAWISSPAIHYHVAIDGISVWLVILTTLLTPICVLVSWRSIDKRVKEFFAFLLLLEFGLIGVFCALDLFLFYVFWEVSLVPMYFLIGIWGHERRHLRHREILPLHYDRLGPDADGHHLSLQPGRHV